MVLERTYDAVVVGARISGCAVALQLARRGWRVALVERKHRPLPTTLSVPIVHARGLARFRALGLWPALQRILPELKPQRTVWMHPAAGIIIQGNIPAHAGFDASYILPRERIDEALLAYILAQEPEAITFYEAHTLVDLLRGDANEVTGVVVQREDDSGYTLSGVRQIELRAPLVIGADGRMSTLARLVQARPYNTRESSTTLYYSYARGVEWSGLADLLFLGAAQQRLVVMSEVAPGLQVLSTFFPVEQFGEFRLNRERELWRSWQTVPELRGRLDRLELLGQVQGLTPQPGYFRPAGGPGWALVGDAAHFKDPASGQGFHDALFTVERFLDAVDTINAGGPLSEEQAASIWPLAAARMQRARDRALRPMYAFTYAFGEALTHPPNTVERALLRTLAADRGAAQHFLGIASGATNVSAFVRAAPGYVLSGLLMGEGKAERPAAFVAKDKQLPGSAVSTVAQTGNQSTRIATQSEFAPRRSHPMRVAVKHSTRTRRQRGTRMLARRTKSLRAGMARVPFYGYLGVLLTALAWISSWGKIGPSPYTFFPLWLGYILFVDALNVARSGSSILTRSWRRFLALFPLSAAFWWVFEWVNDVVQNWHYLSDQPYPAIVRNLLATLYFCTVLPAVLETAELFASFPRLRPRLARGEPAPRLPAAWAIRLMAVGVVLLAAALRFPGQAFVLIWLFLIFLLDPINNLAGRPSAFGHLLARDWRFLVALPLAGLFCGFFWEMWNIHALPQWYYTIPFIDRAPHLFAMPLPGYLGYLPFALELYAMYQSALLFLNQRDDGLAM